MDVNLALVALIFWVAFSLGVAALLDGRKQASRAVPVLHPRYHSPYDRRHPFR